jgi:hypothetical protein
MQHYQDSTQKKQTLADLLDLDTDKKNCFSFDVLFRFISDVFEIVHAWLGLLGFDECYSFRKK